MRFGAEESRKVLSVLIDARRVTASQASAALKRFDRTVAELRSRLAALESGTVSSGRRRRGGRVRRRTQVTRRQRRRVSAQRKKSMRDQGKYLAAVRFLRKPERARIKKIRADQGLAAALKEAGRLAKAS